MHGKGPKTSYALKSVQLPQKAFLNQKPTAVHLGYSTQSRFPERQIPGAEITLRLQHTGQMFSKQPTLYWKIITGVQKNSGELVQWMMFNAQCWLVFVEK